MRKQHTRRIGKYYLERTCSSSPEQYEVFDTKLRHVAYLRLRHGCFSVECPDVWGSMIYVVEPNGFGNFKSGERKEYLKIAIKRIDAFYKTGRGRKILKKI